MKQYMFICVIILKRNSQQIFNPTIIDRIKESHQQFKASKKKHEEFFGVSILFALKYDSDNFNLKSKKLKYDRVIMIFGDGSKKKDEYFVGEDFSKVIADSPIQIKIDSLFALLGTPRPNVPIEHGPCTIYKLHYTKDHHGKNILRGQKHYTVPGGNGPINIGVFDWPSDQLFWLPSKNLLDDVHRCTKTPKCGYETTRMKVYIHQHRNMFPRTCSQVHVLKCMFSSTCSQVHVLKYM